MLSKDPIGISMQAEGTGAPGCVRLSVQGGFRHADRGAFIAAVDRAVRPGCTKVLLDLRDVHFVDSVALGILAMTYHQLKRRKVEFGLLTPSESVLRLLTISGIPNIMPIYRTETDAFSPDAASPA